MDRARSARDRQTLVFDADDTLWENNVLFERTVERYFDWLAHPTLDRAGFRHVLNAVELTNIPVHGYGTQSFLRSLGDCVERIHGRPATAAEREVIAALAPELVSGHLELVPGVVETLVELSGRHDLLMMTKGAVAEQQRKIDASDLAKHFRSVHIVAEKRPENYRALVAEQGLTASATWMIGNSPRSDILAARGGPARGVHPEPAHLGAGGGRDPRRRRRADAGSPPRAGGALLMAADPLTAPAVSCVFVCHDGHGRVLLARRGAGARDEPGTWDTGAGALEHGETFAAAVAREVREEYTVDPLHVETIGVRNVLRGTAHWVAVVNAVLVDPAGVAIGEPHKFDEIGWFAVDALPAPLHSQLPATLELFVSSGPCGTRPTSP
ncbi:NUDIX domain-containing protein [Pseudonocardia sp. GCM10023141]|uniref:NUDIX domain-containing protein n=1 Tax=Pseudonocardia sp. GCM10023141 TaxID=3252653 RepID=UPI003618224C